MLHNMPQISYNARTIKTTEVLNPSVANADLLNNMSVELTFPDAFKQSNPFKFLLTARNPAYDARGSVPV